MLLASILAVAPATAAPKAKDSLRWHSCYEQLREQVWPDEFAFEFGGPVRFECSQVQVPLDYDGSAGGTIQIPLVRIPAQDQSQRIGSLFTNPGGPGGSGIEFTLFTAPFAFGPDVRASFDIVGFDPRGILFSRAARCFGNEKQAEGVLSGISVPRSDEDIAQWLEADANIQAACDQRGRRILDHMSTANVARDLDRLREAVGDEQLTYAGFSYGTMVGATYANLFPDNIRAMVLDSALDPVDWTTGRGDGSTVPVTTRLGSHVGGQAALEQFFALCEEAGPEFCPIAGDAAGRWAAVLAALDAAPVTLEFPIFDENGELVGVESFEYGGDDFLGETLGLLYAGDFWPIISFIVADIEQLLSGPPPEFEAQFALDIQALRAGEDNSFATRAGIDVGAEFSRRPNYFNFLEGFPGVLCADADNPADIGAWFDAAAASEAESVFGALWAWNSSICNGWPFEDTDRYTGPWDAQTSNTVLILNNSFDPATPIEGARAMEAALGNAHLIEVVGGRGHIAVQWSPCAYAVQDYYLLTGEIPPIDSCDPSVANPFDLFGPPPGVLALIEPISGEGEPIVVVLVEGPTPELPVALDPETGEPLNIDPDTGEILPIVIIEILDDGSGG